MTAERVYLVLLRVYPKSFRRQYERRLLEAFRELRQEFRGSSREFWWFVISDVGRSALGLHLAGCRRGAIGFPAEWAVTCASGAIAIAFVANALTCGVSYLYHPYLEGRSVPNWMYGALLGVSLGLTQIVLLRKRCRLGLAWVIASGAGAALGLEVAITTAKVTGPIAYGLVLGGIVGAVQWAVLRTRSRRAVGVGIGGAVALSIALAASSHSLRIIIDGVNPLSHSRMVVQQKPNDDDPNFLARGLYAPNSYAELAIECAVMTICGVVASIFTARPLSRLYAHQERL
jgi:hypothetical protein